MKSFIQGALGAILVLVLAALIIPLYSDYRDRARIAEIIHSVDALKNDIEKKLLAGKPIQAMPIKGKSKFIQQIERTSNGLLIVKAKGNGQLIILIPRKESNSIVWRCIGGPNKDVPAHCRGT